MFYEPKLTLPGAQEIMVSSTAIYIQSYKWQKGGGTAKRGLAFTLRAFDKVGFGSQKLMPQYIH